MSEEIYKSPEAELNSPNQAFPKDVNRPSVIYFMAIWSFIGLSGFLSTAVRVLGRGNPEVLQIGGLAVLVFAIFFFIYILQMKRMFIIIFGILCIALALWQSFNILGILLSEIPSNPIVYFLLFYIIPSAILAALALRPNFLELADNYRAFKHFQSMQKASLKAMRSINS